MTEICFPFDSFLFSKGEQSLVDWILSNNWYLYLSDTNWWHMSSTHPWVSNSYNSKEKSFEKKYFEFKSKRCSNKDRVPVYQNYSQLFTTNVNISLKRKIWLIWIWMQSFLNLFQRIEKLKKFYLLNKNWVLLLRSM